MNKGKYIENFWWNNYENKFIEGISFSFKTKKDRDKFKKINFAMIPQFKK